MNGKLPGPFCDAGEAESALMLTHLKARKLRGKKILTKEELYLFRRGKLFLNILEIK
jgi:hypothetical protein